MNKKPHLMKTIGQWTWNSELVLSKVDKKSKYECWEWQGSKTIHAPLFGARKNNRPQMTQAARILYREYFNEDCEEKEVSHTCKNKNCMNPEHWLILDIKRRSATSNTAASPDIKQATLKPVKSRAARWWQE